MFIVTRHYQDEEHRSKLSKRDILPSAWLGCLGGEEHMDSWYLFF
jgi:hypothetical protein